MSRAAAVPAAAAAAEPRPDFPRALAWSAAGHAALLAAAWALPRLDLSPAPPVEVEITSSYLGDGPAKLGAPKPFVPGLPAPVNVAAEAPAVTTPVPPSAHPKEWVLPGPGTRAAEPEAPPAPTPGGAPGGTGTAARTGGSGEGSDEGVPGGRGHGGSPLSALPRLLNREEVSAGLRRFYPEAERRAGREADVVAALHIAADGGVSGVDIIRSGGAAFDEAARRVGLLMRFSPARGLDGRPVPVKIPQAFQFRLTDG